MSFHEFELPDIVVSALLGLILGSFCTALVHRVPSGISWGLMPGAERKERRSACPACGHTLAALDLIPLLSWIALRGHCRYCRARISAFYPSVELASACACAFIGGLLGLNAASFPLMFCVPFLMAMAIIDFRYFILPDSLNAAVALIWPFYFLASGEPYADAAYHLGAAAAYAAMAWLLGAIMKKALKKETLGMGDVKFFGVAGLWLGWGPFPAFLIASGVLGIIVGVMCRILRKTPYFPFGPALISACWVLMLGEAAGQRAILW